MVVDAAASCIRAWTSSFSTFAGAEPQVIDPHATGIGGAVGGGGGGSGGICLVARSESHRALSAALLGLAMLLLLAGAVVGAVARLRSKV